MSANQLTSNMIRTALRLAMQDLRRRVNDAIVDGMRPSQMAMPNWLQGQTSMIRVFFGSDVLLPQDLRDEIYSACIEANWLMSGKYPEKQPCAWPN